MKRKLERVEWIVVHCSAEERYPHDSLDIDRWHKANGWAGCGYHAVIPFSGEIQLAPEYPCRGLDAQGAHVYEESVGKGLNHNSLGMCICGLFDNETPLDRQWTPAVWLAVRWAQANGLGAERIIGHREAQKMLKGRADRACPGYRFDMDKFRADAATLISGEPSWLRDYRELYKLLAGNERGTQLLNRVRQYLPDVYDGGE